MIFGSRRIPQIHDLPARQVLCLRKGQFAYETPDDRWVLFVYAFCFLTFFGLMLAARLR